MDKQGNLAYPCHAEYFCVLDPPPPQFSILLTFNILVLTMFFNHVENNVDPEQLASDKTS